MFFVLTQSLKNRLHDNKSKAGFTTIEVLVGVLITLIFMLVAIQTIAVAAAIRVKAQETKDAVTWVDNDLDVIERQAKNLGGYDSDAGTYTSMDRSRCAAATANAGFAAQLQAQADNHADPNSVDAAIGTSDTDPKVSPIGNRDYTLRRQTSITNAAPHTLKVQYDVFQGSGTSGTPIYSYFAEVIPGVTFACKQI